MATPPRSPGAILNDVGKRGLFSMNRRMAMGDCVVIQKWQTYRRMGITVPSVGPLQVGWGGLLDGEKEFLPCLER